MAVLPLPVPIPFPPFPPVWDLPRVRLPDNPFDGKIPGQEGYEFRLSNAGRLWRFIVDRFRTETESTPAPASLVKLADLVEQALQTSHAARTESGSRFTVDMQADFNLGLGAYWDNAIAAMRPPVSLPRFDSMGAAEQWHSGFRDEFGAAPNQDQQRILLWAQAWFTAEQHRLNAINWQKFAADTFAALRPIILAPTFASEPAAAAWLNDTRALLEPFAHEVVVQLETLPDWQAARAWYDSEIARLRGLAPPPAEPAITTPPFASLVAADTWLAETRTKLQAYATATGKRLEDLPNWAKAQAWYDSEAARLAAAGGGVVIPRPGTILDAAGMAGALQTLLSGLGIQGGALTAVGENLFQRIGRQSHRGRLDSTGTTIDTIIGTFARMAGPIIPAVAILGTDAGRAIVDKMSDKLFDIVLNPDLLKHPVDIDKAPGNAAKLLTQKLALGSTAHIWAVTAEMWSPLKQLGLNQFAGALADFAGFSRLAQGTLGQVEEAAIVEPMRQHARRLYRPALAQVGMIESMYAKKELPPGPIPEGYPPRAGFTQPPADAPAGTFYEQMARYGHPDWMIRTLSSSLFLDPRMSEIIRIGQFFNPQLVAETRDPPPFVKNWIDARPWLLEQIKATRAEWDADWYFYYRAAQGGYSPPDVRIVVETAKRAVVRRENTLALDAATRMYREGFIGDAELSALVEEIWAVRPGPDGTMTFAGNPIKARIRATELRTRAEVLGDIRNMTLLAMKRGVINEAEAVTQLAGLGMPAQRIRLEVASARLGLLPGVRLTIPLDQPEDAAFDDAE